MQLASVTGRTERQFPPQRSAAGGVFQDIMSVRRYEPGELICRQGDPADAAFHVLEGEVKLYKLTADGRRQIVEFLKEGDFVGLSCDDEYAYSAEALTQARVGRLPRARLEQLLARSPELGARLLNFARRELACAHEQMLVLGRMSPLERVASFLLRLSQAAEDRGETGERLALPMSRLDIADHLGLTIETVSRCFTKLRKARIIDLPHASDVVLLDAERLADLASGDQDSIRQAA